MTDPRLQQNEDLLRSIKRGLPQLEALLERANREWGMEDGVYRFYHQSFKVYRMQEETETIVNALAALSPLQDVYFKEILDEGTGHRFAESHNQNWTKHTRPIVEAFFHAHYFLTMVVKYGRELEEAPLLLPSGWAAVLCLYGQR